MHLDTSGGDILIFIFEKRVGRLRLSMCVLFDRYAGALSAAFKLVSASRYLCVVGDGVCNRQLPPPLLLAALPCVLLLLLLLLLRLWLLGRRVPSRLRMRGCSPLPRRGRLPRLLPRVLRLLRRKDDVSPVISAAGGGRLLLQPPHLFSEGRSRHNHTALNEVGPLSPAPSAPSTVPGCRHKL